MLMLADAQSGHGRIEHDVPSQQAIQRTQESSTLVGRVQSPSHGSTESTEQPIIGFPTTEGQRTVGGFTHYAEQVTAQAFPIGYGLSQLAETSSSVHPSLSSENEASYLAPWQGEGWSLGLRPPRDLLMS